MVAITANRIRALRWIIGILWHSADTDIVLFPKGERHTPHGCRVLRISPDMNLERRVVD
jgi:hypothetical protein